MTRFVSNPTLKHNFQNNPVMSRAGLTEVNPNSDNKVSGGDFYQYGQQFFCLS